MQRQVVAEVGVDALLLPIRAQSLEITCRRQTKDSSTGTKMHATPYSRSWVNILFPSSVFLITRQSITLPPPSFAFPLCLCSLRSA